MTALLRAPATVVWIMLVLATMISWALGTERGIGNQSFTSVLILLIAFIKVRLVGLYFMELREAPFKLRGLFEAYCIVVCTLLIGVFILA